MLESDDNQILGTEEEIIINSYTMDSVLMARKN
jgi:hypothetical protein